MIHFQQHDTRDKLYRLSTPHFLYTPDKSITYNPHFLYTTEHYHAYITNIQMLQYWNNPQMLYKEAQ